MMCREKDMSLTSDVYCCTTPARVTLVAPVGTTTAGSRRARQKQQQQQWWHACCTVVACMPLASWPATCPAAVCACVPDELRMCVCQTNRHLVCSYLEKAPGSARAAEGPGSPLASGTAAASVLLLLLPLTCCGCQAAAAGAARGGCSCRLPAAAGCWSEAGQSAPPLPGNV